MILISFFDTPLSHYDKRQAVLKLKHESKKKKKTPSLVLLVNMVIEETWADRGVTLDTSASEGFFTSAKLHYQLS